MVKKCLWGRREKSGGVPRRLEGVKGSGGPEESWGAQFCGKEWCRVDERAPEKFGGPKNGSRASERPPEGFSQD